MRRIVAVAAPAALVALLLSGCVQQESPAPSPSATATAGSSSPAPEPTLVPGGSAQDDLAYFDLVNNRLFASNGGADGRAIIDNLVSAGFDKTAMQVTPDKTAINGNVDSILFSVRIGESCLLGQHGGGGYSSSVAPGLAGGGCLVGKTRPIDW